MVGVRVSNCCCGCSLKTGTILIGVCYLVSYLVVVILISIILGAIDNKDVQKEFIKSLETKPSEEKEVIVATKVVFGILLVCCILDFLLNVMLVFGAVQEKAKLIYIWFVIHTVFLVIETVMFFVSLITEGNLASKGLTIAFAILNILLTIYFHIVVYSFYKELKEKGQIRRGQPTAMNIEG